MGTRAPIDGLGDEGLMTSIHVDTVLELERVALDAHLGADAIGGNDDLEVWVEPDGSVSFSHDGAVYCLRQGSAWRVRLTGDSKAELTCWRDGDRVRTATVSATEIE